MENLNQFNFNATSSSTQEWIPSDKLEQENEPSTANLCIACNQSSRAVAFVPCAHYIACLPCGHGMTDCPMCRSKIIACLKIYE